MTQYILVSIVIYLILISIIVILSCILAKNKDKKLKLYQKNEQDKAMIVDNINNKSLKEIRELRNEVVEAKSFDAIKSVLINKLFN